MANYYIIGSDGKEYGPVSPAQIRQWCADNRANAQSQVRPEQGGNFVPLGSIPELNAPIGMSPGPAFGPAYASSREDETVKSLAATLASASGWMKFVAVVMFIMGGFYVLSIWGIVIAWLPIWLGVVLMNAATKATKARDHNSLAELRGALDRLRFYFKLTGIMMIFGVLIIPGLLAAMAIPAFSKVREMSRVRLITNNLRQFTSASQQYMLDKGVTQANYQDVAGTEPDKIMHDLHPVVGEDYTSLRMRQGQTEISISSPTVGTVTYNL